MYVNVQFLTLQKRKKARRYRNATLALNELVASDVLQCGAEKTKRRSVRFFSPKITPI